MYHPPDAGGCIVVDFRRLGRVVKAFRRHIKAHMSHIEGLQSCFYLFAQGKGEGFDLVNILTLKGSI